MLETEIDHSEQWSNSKKFISLFIIWYLLLYMFPFPLDRIPVIGDVVSYYTQAIDFISLWFGTHILHIKNLEQLSNAGDYTFLYVIFLTVILLALILAVFSFLISRSQKNYKNFYYFTITYAKYYVGLYMITYGFMKIFGGQFVFPPLKVLESSFGILSPQQLFWSFMGYSKLYGTFIAIGEILSGYLLLFRRTKVFGALIIIVIMLNVLMLDISFDLSSAIIFSSNLLLITFIIISPNIKRIIAFIFLQKTLSLDDPANGFRSKGISRSALILKTVIIIGFSILIIYPGIQSRSVRKITPPLYGVYYTTAFVINQDTSHTLMENYWRRIIIDRRTTYITTYADSTAFYKSTIDTVKKSMKLVSLKNPSVSYNFLYNATPDSLRLTGSWNGNNVLISLKKKSINDYFLINKKPKNVSKEF